METLSFKELQAKLEVYKEQLQQVDGLILYDSTNEQLLKLKEDLGKVIKLTTDLLNDQKTNSDVSQTHNSPIIHSANWKVGDKIEVSSGDRPYAGVITAINGDICKVKYFEYETEVELPINSLNSIQPGEFDVTAVNPPGFKCQCKFSQDQRWYDVTVDAVTEYGFMVTYTQYGTSEEVPLGYLRPLQIKKNKDKADKTDCKGLIVIPESLKILPTDTEAVGVFILCLQ